MITTLAQEAAASPEFTTGGAISAAAVLAIVLPIAWRVVSLVTELLREWVRSRRDSTEDQRNYRPCLYAPGEIRDPMRELSELQAQSAGAMERMGQCQDRTATTLERVAAALDTQAALAEARHHELLRAIGR